MLAEMPADGRRLANRIEAGDTDRAASGEKKRGENTEKRGLAGSIGAEQSNGFARFDVKRNVAKGWNRGGDKRLDKGTPAAEGGRKRFFERIDGDGGVGH